MVSKGRNDSGGITLADPMRDAVDFDGKVAGGSNHSKTIAPPNLASAQHQHLVI
jgi:hypothetical protein